MDVLFPRWSKFTHIPHPKGAVPRCFKFKPPAGLSLLTSHIPKELCPAVLSLNTKPDPQGAAPLDVINTSKAA